VGEQQGRQKNCAKNLTDFEAQVYINRNPDLQHKFGRSGKDAIASARQHYIDYGHASGANVAMEDWDQPWFCGEYDPTNVTHLTECGCNGVMHMGPVSDQLSGKRLSTFDDMRKWKTLSKSV
jgi:hypothetical protein